MRNIQNQKGMSLVEVMIGVAVTGITAYVLSSVEINIGKNVVKLRETAELAKALNSIHNEIYLEAITLESQDEPTTINGGGDIRTILADTFAPASTLIRVERCYTYEILKGDCSNPTFIPKIKFRAQFYKYQVTNRSYTDAALKKLPLSRVNTQISYLNKEGVTEVHYLSSLMANTLSF